MNLTESIRNQYLAASSPAGSEARCFFLKMVQNQRCVLPVRNVQREKSVCQKAAVKLTFHPEWRKPISLCCLPSLSTPGRRWWVLLTSCFMDRTNGFSSSFLLAGFPPGTSMGPLSAMRLVLADPVRPVHSKTNCLPSRLFTLP